jgi:hypothetical protein
MHGGPYKDDYRGGGKGVVVPIHHLVVVRAGLSVVQLAEGSEVYVSC